MSKFLKLAISFIKAQAVDMAIEKALSIGDKTVKSSTTNRFTPLRPIAGIFWLLHPQKALYFFILQKSLLIAWSIIKAIINKKI